MSVTIIGVIVSLLGFLAAKSGVQIAPENIQNFVEVGAQFVGLLIAYWGRYRQGDINPLGGRKTA